MSGAYPQFKTSDTHEELADVSAEYEAAMWSFPVE
jgi:hypothetical protein